MVTNPLPTDRWALEKLGGRDIGNNRDDKGGGDAKMRRKTHLGRSRVKEMRDAAQRSCVGLHCVVTPPGLMLQQVVASNVELAQMRAQRRLTFGGGSVQPKALGYEASRLCRLPFYKCGSSSDVQVEKERRAAPLLLARKRTMGR